MSVNVLNQEKSNKDEYKNDRHLQTYNSNGKN